MIAPVPQRSAEVHTEASAGGSLAAAARLEAEGRSLDAVALLTEACRRAPAPEVQEALVGLRHRAWRALGGEQGPGAAPVPVEPGTRREDDGMPCVRGEELTAGRVAGALASHGALIVRGLVDPGQAAALAGGIDRCFDAKAAADEGAEAPATAPWYVPFEPEGEGREAVGIGRKFLSGGSGVWLADSPRMMFDLLDTFEQAGARAVVTDFLGERPALSVNKGTLRRARPTVGTAWWHQDGAFLGRDIRSLNIWLALSPCGRDAPGLEMVPRRLDGIVEAGTHGADFAWSVGDEVVEEVSGGRIASPVFEAGDALLFDHLFLHRTGVDESMTQTRYASETWFFAPSAYPDPAQQVPLAF
jgi:hypothetical protein